MTFASAASNAAAALGKSLNASPLSADCFCASVAVDRYISYRRGKDIVSLSVFLLKDQPIEAHEFHVIAPLAVLEGGKPIAEIRPTATEAQKQTADSGLAFTDLASAAAVFEAALSKIAA